jgi:hypothetical protein
MIEAARARSTLVQDPTNFTSESIGHALTVDLGAVLIRIAAIRAAERVIYVIAAPLVALGSMDTDGETWSAWWKALVMRSLSEVVTIRAFTGFVGTTQVLTAVHTLTLLIAVARATLPIGGFGPAAMRLMEIARRLITVGRLMVGWMVAALELPDRRERFWGVGWRQYGRHTASKMVAKIPRGAGWFMSGWQH